MADGAKLAAGCALGRRQFSLAAISTLGLLAAGCTTTTNGGGSVAGGPVSIAMADGEADALLYRPAGNGHWPALLVWTDGSGLRPAYNELGRRLAAQGYVVLIPNIYYRSVKLDGSMAAPVLPPEEGRARSAQWREAANEQALIADSRAYMAYLDVQPATDRRRKAGTLGFDYGSASAFYAARAVPDRIGAVAALYPMGTATPRPNSPHLFVAQSKAAYHIVMTKDDDAREPGDKDDFRKAFTDAGLEGSVEVSASSHGFAIPGGPPYDQAAADAALSDVATFLTSHLD